MYPCLGRTCTSSSWHPMCSWCISIVHGVPCTIVGSQGVLQATCLRAAGGEKVESQAPPEKRPQLPPRRQRLSPVSTALASLLVAVTQTRGWDGIRLWSAFPQARRTPRFGWFVSPVLLGQFPLP